MKLKKKALPIFVFGCLTLCSSAFASDPNSSSVRHPVRKNNPAYTYKGDIGYKGDLQTSERGNHFEVIGGLGIAKLKAGNSSLTVTSSETDSLVQNNSSNWNTFGAQLGGGYIYYFCDPHLAYDHVRWLSAIEPEVNLYYLGSNSVDGNVYRYGSSRYGQMNYDMPVRSTRLMLDVALTLVAYKKLSFFGIAGIGNAWNRVGYSDTSYNPACPDQTLNLNYNTTSHFAWEAGPGLLYDFNDRVGLSFEYLFTYLGKVRPGSGGNYGTITAPNVSFTSFTLRAQTAMLGLHVALG